MRYLTPLATPTVAIAFDAFVGTWLYPDRRSFDFDQLQARLKAGDVVLATQRASKTNEVAPGNGLAAWIMLCKPRVEVELLGRTAARQVEIVQCQPVRVRQPPGRRASDRPAAPWSDWRWRRFQA